MPPAKSTRVSPSAKKDHFEFGGPIGAALNLVALPAVIFALYFLCTPDDVFTVSPSPLSYHIPAVDFWNVSYFKLDSLLVFLGWFAFLVVLERFLPTRIVKGVVLSTGKRLNYRLNGLSSYLIAMVSLITAQFYGLIDLGFVYDNYLTLATSSMMFCYTLSIILYLQSFQSNKLLAAGGNTSSPVYNFFIGRELNPRWGTFDWKYFCELRPGLIGWVVINLGMMVKQYELHGEVSPAMILVNLFQFIYVTDALVNEQSILSTMDITTDGFGFMLVFGDLAWVPFTYTLQTRFLVDHSPALELWHIAAILVCELVGLYIFRSANSQKDTFRRNPNHASVKHLKYIDTKRGTRLLVSGWWGYSRHINYFGDWLMAWAWCLPCGFKTIIPYFYVIYFGILLVHREFRDEHCCRQKYGDDWKRYCSIVPYRIIPYVF